MSETSYFPVVAVFSVGLAATFLGVPFSGVISGAAAGWLGYGVWEARRRNRNTSF